MKFVFFDIETEGLADDAHILEMAYIVTNEKFDEEARGSVLLPGKVKARGSVLLPGKVKSGLGVLPSIRGYLGYTADLGYCDTYVQDMHATSGLLTALQNSLAMFQGYVFDVVQGPLDQPVIEAEGLSLWDAMQATDSLPYAYIQGRRDCLQPLPSEIDVRDWVKSNLLSFLAELQRHLGDEPVFLAGYSVHFDYYRTKKLVDTVWPNFFKNHVSYRLLDLSSFRLMYKAVGSTRESGSHILEAFDVPVKHRAMDDCEHALHTARTIRLDLLLNSERNETVSLPLPKPLRNLVLVQRDEAPERTTSGLYVPEAARETQVSARVLAAGPKTTEVKPGDLVYLGKWVGQKVDYDGQEMLFIPEDELLGVEV